ncbi:MAG: peptidase M42 [Sulfurimonas sp. RIFOXYD12_FULL_33_39]|uniref:peptidase M42 n=1 Tax=unclassified Sulfurimonas TaxID=2623549 RepID=UPI0008BC847F|nr:MULTISPECIES: peptidase M42 [unclassified Sulfurimonas]OHE05131.1 MAG: peptidase M42 [Sulfurimonas sp. RIFCSPLOWO2_12_FULL_34_6]OHE09608.1 MAG: peptidase M42 [Sulfurimonas sp. RIFOXYD12_FULL_33_39]OHE13885.1 MAG: peptidase M42 [Sulfurimonas sp. RIFOXYD2_FULL_34_21]DAB28526.1 MAG TPA: peptidase M42 [Sulfurimonas sp. UBA10385]
MELFYDILKQLIRIPSVVGAEHPFFMFIKRELEELGVTVEYYDGVLVAKGSEPQSGYISAHTDRHGLICTGHNEFQYAAFIAKNKADLTGDSNSEQLLHNFTARFVDEKVQAYQPWSGTYLGLGSIKDAYLCQRRNNIIFKIDGFDYLLPGTPIAFTDKLEIKDDLISAQLDNVISIAIIIYMYSIGYQGTAFFTASEEAGRSWRFLLEWFRRFDIKTNELLVLDTSPYPTLDEIKNIDIVLRHRDSNAVFRSPLKNKIKKIAVKEGIKYSFKDTYLKDKMLKNGNKVSLGTTELGRLIHASKGEIQGTTLQIPTIGYHTVHETTTKNAVESMITILKKVYVK